MKPITEQQWFKQIKRPSRYIGNEINAIRKDPLNIEVSVALAFPDLYEIGMSHQGLKILYHILNNLDWLTAERVFSVGVDLEKELRQREIPLTTLESYRPLSDFDIIGFSLQYELSFTNILTILDLSDIPFLAAKRDDSFPLIIAGGPVCFNPEPVADLFDAFVIGDGEEAILEICTVIRLAKKQKTDRKEVLHRLSTIQGVYIPSFFNIQYGTGETIQTIEALSKNYHTIRKAVIADINQSPFPFNQVVPFTSLIHDRLAIEITRGCTRGCRFCQAGMIYRPVRERNPHSIISNLNMALKHTGYDEVSLLSLSSGDYSCITPLLKELMDLKSTKNIAVSLPSLRADSMDPVWFEQIKRVRKTGFTLAPEVGSERMRKVINKSLTNNEILDMARYMYDAGWNLIKLYFMIGLPGEMEKDLDAIIALAKAVVNQAKGKRKRAKLNVSISTFVPKSHTPFMWAPQISYEESQRRIRYIRNALKKTPIRVKWNEPDQSWLEGVFARGDRRLTSVLIEAWLLGARFDAWRDYFNMEIWKRAFRKSSLDPGFYLYRIRSLDESLPWDHIHSGVTKNYLKREWIMAQEGKETPDCRKTCLQCGVCDHETVDLKTADAWDSSFLSKRTPVEFPPIDIKKYRITYSKKGTAKHLSHLELAQVFIRAINRAGLTPVFSKGYHPMPKVSFLSALPIGTESLDETVDIELQESLSEWEVKNKLGRQLPNGLDILNIKDISKVHKKSIIKESHYEITFFNYKIDPIPLQRFLQSDHYPITTYSAGKKKIVDARPLVKHINLTPPDGIYMILKHVSGPNIKPIDVMKEVFQIDNDHINGTNILKTKQVIE